MKRLRIANQYLYIFSASALVFACVWLATSMLARQLEQTYAHAESAITKDRNGNIIAIQKNNAGYYAVYTQELPDRFTRLLIHAEDRYFYSHKGVNVGSMARALYRTITQSKSAGSSTITQQLVKVLRNAEFERSIGNKFIETIYALSLELHTNKSDILTMYANTVYFGNQTQGMTTASMLYFGVQPRNLTTEQTIALLATITSPSEQNPFMTKNARAANALAARIGVSAEPIDEMPLAVSQTREKAFRAYTRSTLAFETDSLGLNCATTWLDQQLTEQIRAITERVTNSLASKNATHAAVVVLQEPENQLIAMVGSPRPLSDAQGNQINMALGSRPIGSTIKPFIYTKGFEAGLRPYTMVDDKEYKYTIGSGYAFYPKNYDFAYHGPVSLHYALSNSLNVPTVKVLEYAGLENFYSFLTDDLHFMPIQNLRNYQLGIALGGLEMDLLTLSYYFSIFPNHGSITPLEACAHSPLAHITQTRFNQQKMVIPQAYVELMNKILTDRKTGVEQFGLATPLSVIGLDIAAKTGTSREYHDSWTIGYTPDFVIGVWLGNTDNTAMDAVSGASGAGEIWHQVAELLANSTYNKKTPFTYAALAEFKDGISFDYGFPHDDYAAQKLLLTTHDLILSPHDADTILLEENTRIPLHASVPVRWSVNGAALDSGATSLFVPSDAGVYYITATPENGEAQTITLRITENQE